MRQRGIIALAFAVSVLSACSGGGGSGGGGGGGSAPPPGQQTTVSGTVAANIPLGGYDVAIVAPAGGAGSLGPQVTTGSDGRYSARVEGLLPPQHVTLIRAGRFVQDGEPQYQRLYSLPNGGSGSSNVTPLTSLLVARLLNRKPEFLLDGRAANEIGNRSASEIGAAQQDVVAYLLNNRPRKDNGNFTSPVDVSAVTDFVAMPLNPALPGDPYSEALKRLHDSMMDSETIAGMEEHMLFRNDPAADLGTMLTLDFVASCPASGDPTLPAGTTRVVLDSQGVTFGGVQQFAFQAGDRVTVIAGQTNDNQWRFDRSGADTRSVTFEIVHGRVTSATLQIDLKAAPCTPSGDVLISGRHPSLIALVRRLAGATAPAFDCAGTITYPGFRATSNFVTFDTNGAMRINSLSGGPSLHLPSLDIIMEARFVLTGGQLTPRPSRFNASRFFRGGGDVFSVALDADGTITGLSLGRTNEQSSFGQSCGVI